MNSEPRVTFIRDPDVVMPSTPITTDTPIDVNVTGGTLVASVVMSSSPQPIKDGVGAMLSTVQAANGATAVTANVLLVQHVDDQGNTLRETTQDNIDLNTANTALVMLDLDETGSRQLSAIQGVQTSVTGLATDQSAIRMSGTRDEGLLGVTNSDLLSIRTNTADLSAIRMSGTRVEGLVSTGNTTLSTIQTNTTNIPADEAAIRQSGTRAETWLSRLNALETTIASNTANFAGTVMLRATNGQPLACYGEAGGGGQHLGVSIIQDVVASIVNSSAVALPFGGTFLGSAETTLGVNSIQVSLKADQNAVCQVDQSPDGINWDIADSLNYYHVLGGNSWTIQAVSSYYRVHIANAGTGNMSYMRMQTALCPVVEALPRALTAGGNLRVAANELLPTFGESIKSTPHNQLQVAQTYRLAGATFSGTDTVNSVDSQYWIKTRTGADADATTFEAQGTLATGTTANGSILLNSNRVARFITGSSIKYRGVIILPPIVGANTRRWGAFDATDGLFFEHDGATLYCVSRKSSLDTRVPNGSFSGDQGNTYIISLNVPYNYEIYWTNRSVYFLINGAIIHKMVSGTYSIVGNQNLKVGSQCVNTGANANNNRLFVRAAGISRLGPDMTQPTWVQQTGLIASRVLKYGVGNLRGVHVSNITTTAVASLYDATSVVAANLIWSSGQHLNNQSLMPYDINFHNLPFANGLTLAVTTAALNATVVFE